MIVIPKAELVKIRTLIQDGSPLYQQLSTQPTFDSIKKILKWLAKSALHERKKLVTWRYDIYNPVDQDIVQKLVEIKQNQYKMQFMRLTKWLKFKQQESHFCIQLGKHIFGKLGQLQVWHRK